MEEIRMEVTPSYELVPGIRTCVARIANNFGFDEREAYRLQTVVDEICNNAIEHGTRTGDKIKIECKFTKGQVEFTVKDTGNKDFKPDEMFEQNLKKMEDEIENNAYEFGRRGRGLILVKKLVDRLDIKTGKDGTVITVVKKSVYAEKT